MDTNLLNYQATLHVIYNSLGAEIQHILNKKQVLQKRIEIFNDLVDNYKIFIVFSRKYRTVTLKSLILEKAYLETQYLKEFYNYAEANLLPYFNKIRFLYSSSPQDINYYIAIKTPETEANIILASGQIKAPSFTRWLGSFNKAKYEKLGHLHNNDVDDYIEKYLLSKQSPDPVLHLISSYRLYEVIGEKMTGKPIQKKVIDGKNYKYFEDSTGKVVLKIEQLAIAARNLVVHGLVTASETVEELNKEFGTCHLNHKFNRKDEEHMKLVKWSAERFLSIIENYLKNIIL